MSTAHSYAEVTSEADLIAAVSGASRIVFDLDGTLYDAKDFERPALASVVDWLRSQSGLALDGLLEALWHRRETHRHRPGLFDDLLVEFRLPVAWGRECLRRFHDYPGLELRWCASLKETLARIRKNDCRLALVTNGYEILQRRKLANLGIESMFDICVYCDPRRPEQLKPARWAWEKLAAWRAMLPTVYVGDDDVDQAFAVRGDAGFVRFSFGRAR